MNIVNEDVLREYFNIDNSDQSEVDFIIGSENVCNYDLSVYETIKYGKIGKRYYRQKTQEEFIEDAKLRHGDRYDYSKVVYNHNGDKVEIVCKIHGSFFQQAGSHLYGTACPRCAVEYTKSKRKLLLSDVLDNFKKVHGDVYDYSNIKEYVNNSTKMPIVCGEHGLFYKTYTDHFKARGGRGGCNKCRVSTIKGRKLGNGKCDYNWFIDRSKSVHGDRYDYSKVKYIGSRKKVEIICRIHGGFWQNPYSHATGSNCTKCSGQYSHNTTEFIELCKKVHDNKYDYSEVIYNGNKRAIKIICKNHGIFEQRPNNHLRGEGCYKCGKESMADIARLTYDKFLKKAKKVHKGRYEYIGFESEYTTVDDTFIRAVCKKHGEFKQKVHPHLSGSGCTMCNASKGEYRIKMWLDENNITYEPQKTFNKCINPDTKRRLKFDFYIPDKNLVIEYDGKQHFEVSNFCNDVELAKELFEKVKKHDQIKNAFVNNNKINILRISYKEFNKIEEILKYELLKKNDI